jgi:hypothetical protein
LSPVSAVRANGVSWLTRYAALVRSWLAILVTLAACHDPNTEQMIAIKDKVCACTTASCAEQEMKLVPERAIKSTQRTRELARELLDCLAKRQAAEQPSTDPDAEGDAEGDAAPAEPPSGPRTAAPASAKTP